jgi:hypothetical protein
MKAILLILGVIVLIYVFRSRLISGKKTTVVLKKVKPQQEIPNDKLVLVNNISHEDIRRVITGFCTMDDQNSYPAFPRLTKITDSQFAITFPYDIEFEIFCYFTNYLKYPMDFEGNMDVAAWTTTTETDKWISEKSANKKVLLFIPEDDTEHDNVYLTTADNIGYKLSFAVGEEKQLLSTPKKAFVAPPIDIHSLAGAPSEDFG